MQTIVQNLAFGLFVGGIYGVAAAGLALVFGVLKILNVAHGELLMFGGYISFWLFSLLGLDPLVFRYLTHLHGETRIKKSLLVSFGLTLILQNAALASFTADERTIQLSYSAAGIAIGGITLPLARLLSLLITFIGIVALHLFLQRTYPGKAVRAVAEDGESAALAGINVGRVYLYTMALGAALAGMAGSLVVIGYGIAPDIGLSWTLKALVVITLAGTGSVLGAFPAGLLLGLVEAISGMAFGSIHRETAGLVMFLLVLLLRPSGLFGRA